MEQRTPDDPGGIKNGKAGWHGFLTVRVLVMWAAVAMLSCCHAAERRQFFGVVFVHWR